MIRVSTFHYAERTYVQLAAFTDFDCDIEYLASPVHGMLASPQ